MQLPVVPSPFHWHASCPFRAQILTNCTVLTSTSEDYQTFFDNSSLLTDVLCDGVLCNTIHPNMGRLHAADQQCRLDDLLTAMLMHAPHPLGQRYVAFCLHIAHQKGVDEVINAAKAWLDYLMFPSPFVYLSPCVC